jgi:hypothetical protein
LLGDGFVHSSPKLGFHLIQLGLQPFPDRLPQHREPSIAPLLHADMRKAQEVAVPPLRRVTCNQMITWFYCGSLWLSGL